MEQEEDGHFEAEADARPAYVPVSTLLQFDIIKLVAVKSGEEKLTVRIMTANDDGVENLSLTMEDGVELVRRMIWQLGGFGHPMCRELCRVCWPDEEWDRR